MEPKPNPNPLNNLDGSGIRAEKGLAEIMEENRKRIAELKAEQTKGELPYEKQEELINLEELLRRTGF